MTLKYLLTGLVHCAQCNARMAPVSSVGASRTGKRLAYYRCPLHSGGGCSNGRYLREDRLRAAVVACLRSHLLPEPPTSANGTDPVTPAWLAELVVAIRHELHHLSEQTPDRRPALQQKIQELQQQIVGWMASLGKPDLPASVRMGLEGQYAQAADALAHRQAEFSLMDGAQEQIQQVVDLPQAMDRLHRLDEVLAGGNVTAGNMELSLHIDRIDVYEDGRVVMSTSKLGIFEGIVQLLARGSGERPAAGDGYRVTSRRRGRLRLEDPDYQGKLTDADQHAAADPDRFGGLRDKWFWTDSLPLDAPLYWSAQNAESVAVKKTEDPEHWTQARLAEHFGVSIPTIRKALKYAARKKSPTEPTAGTDDHDDKNAA